MTYRTDSISTSNSSCSWAVTFQTTIIVIHSQWKNWITTELRWVLNGVVKTLNLRKKVHITLLCMKNLLCTNNFTPAVHLSCTVWWNHLTCQLVQDPKGSDHRYLLGWPKHIQSKTPCLQKETNIFVNKHAQKSNIKSKNIKTFFTIWHSNGKHSGWHGDVDQNATIISSHNAAATLTEGTVTNVGRSSWGNSTINHNPWSKAGVVRIVVLHQEDISEIYIA